MSPYDFPWTPQREALLLSEEFSQKIFIEKFNNFLWRQIAPDSHLNRNLPPYTSVQVTLCLCLVTVPASGVVKCAMHLGVVTALVCRFALVTPEVNLYHAICYLLYLLSPSHYLLHCYNLSLRLIGLWNAFAFYNPAKGEES